MRGGHGSSGFGSLASRTSATTPAITPATGSASPARHCVVDGEPGLLVEWRRNAAGWEGRVLSMVELDAGGWATVERWLPASRVTSGRIPGRPD